MKQKRLFHFLNELFLQTLLIMHQNGLNHASTKKLDTDKSNAVQNLVMPERGEVVSKRYKIQTRDRSGQWIDFGPFCFNTEESVMNYFDEYKHVLGRARIVEVVETVLRYID